MELTKERSRKYKEEHKEWVKKRSRNYHLKLKYNLTPEQYDEMYNQQDGRCAICNIHQSGLKKNFMIDHNHTTNAVRGLLCGNCNTAIGLLDDSIELIIKAAEYLKKYVNL
jgi:hypothetical protein